MNYRKVLLCTFIFFILASLIIISGAFDWMAPERGINKVFAIGSIAAYCFFAFITYLLIMGWMKKRNSIIILFVSIIVTLILAEVGVRVFHPSGTKLGRLYSYSPERHHIHPPNSELGADIGFLRKKRRITINEDGLRNDRSRQEFLSNKKRIAVVGDSFVYGLFVSQEDRFSHLLEKQLREKKQSDDIAVLNTGTVSYSPFLSKIQFKKVVRHYKPDLVLHFIDTTDIADDIEYSSMAQQKDGEIFFPKECGLCYWPEGSSFMDNSALYQRMYIPMILFRLMVFYPFEAATCTFIPNTVYLEIDGKIENNWYFIYRHSLKHTGKYFRQTLNNIKELAADVRATGGQYVLFLVPRFNHWNVDECPKCWTKKYYSLDDPFQFEFFKFFENQKDIDFRIVNLLPAFKATKEFPLVFETDPHWNPQGHAFVTKKIINYIEKEKLLK